MPSAKLFRVAARKAAAFSRRERKLIIQLAAVEGGRAARVVSEPVAFVP